MKLFPGKRFFLAGLIFAFSQASVAGDCGDDDGRTDKCGPGEAEVIAETGYKHTLFDSAEAKCQHCHNDLYDTWTQSGHSKAWKSPIFQSQFQDVVRGRINQLDLTTETTKEANAKTFKGRVKFCIKCHSPGAWYSNDISILLEDLNEDMGDDPGETTADQLARLRAENEVNIAPGTNVEDPTSVVWFDKAGSAVKATVHIGNGHNREGVNCSYCHSIETVRMLNADVNDPGSDGGVYSLAKPLPGTTYFQNGESLTYSTDGEDTHMNAFFRFAAGEIYADYANTPKTAADFDVNKVFDGRQTIKSIVEGAHTGGPFYGPFGVTGLENHNEEDDALVDRAALVKQSFVADPESQHFEDQSKGLCLSCHQCAQGTKDAETGKFNTGCVVWQANSGFDDATNNTSTDSAPKCTKCHMERVANKTVLHKWDDPDELFTAADGVTVHFDPDSGIGPVAEGYLNNHAFMATQVKEYGPVKLKSAVKAGLKAKMKKDEVKVKASIFNQAGHFFPGTMPMRRALMRVIAYDAEGNKLPLKRATGKSKFKDVRHKVATLPDEEVMKGHRFVKRDAPLQPVTFTGQTPDLDGGEVSSQKFNLGTVPYASVHPGSMVGGAPTEQTGGSWKYEGAAKSRAIVDSEDTSNFTRIYGYQQGRDIGGTFVLRSGMETNKTVVTSLSPNEQENYEIVFDGKDAVGDVTVTYKIYYLTKGANTQFPVGEDGFLDADAAEARKLLISELYSETVSVKGKKK